MIFICITAAKSNRAVFWDKYHPGAWKKEKWSCCMKANKDAEGCKDASDTSSKKPKMPKAIIPGEILIQDF